MIISDQNKVSVSVELQEAHTSSGQTKEPAVTSGGSQTGVNNEGAYLAFVALGDIADGVKKRNRERCPNCLPYAIPDRREKPPPVTMYGVEKPPKPPPVTKYGIPPHKPRLKN